MNADDEAEMEIDAAQRLADAARRGDPAELLTHRDSGPEWMPTPKRRLVFDIETAPLANAAEYLEPVEAPANYRDPVKIAAWKAEKAAEQLDRAALDPDLARIVAIGAWDGESVPWIEAMQGWKAEEDMLRGFWSVVKGYHLVGYNCLSFDLPVLVRRSQYLGIPVPTLDLGKYKHEGITDLMQVLSFCGQQKYRGLDFYCKRFGILSDDRWTGADIPKLVAAGAWVSVEKHLAADLKKTAALAAKLGLFTLSEGK